MQHSHTETYRRLLESVVHYSQKILNDLQSGAGDFPQWTNDLISESRSKIADVTHFLRGEANHGIRYGQANHGRAYMATANLRQIHEYAKESLGYMVEGAGHFPAWVEVKISVVAKYMDLIGHWLENEAVEGRVYGTHLDPVPGDAGDEALYRGRADGIVGKHRNPYSPNSFQRKIYEQGFEEGYGGRHYGARGGDVSSGKKDGGGHGAGGGLSGLVLGAQQGGRLSGGRGHGMGRGSQSRRRHRRLFRIGRNYSRPTPGGPKIPPVETRLVPSPSQEAEFYPTPPLVAELHPTTTGVVYQPGYGSIFPGHAPTVVGKFKPSMMEHTLPPNRMLEAHRQGLQHRQLYQQTGRRFGVPGFAPGTPGWAGAGGVAQIPHPNSGRRPLPDRTFGPGLSAGQGGVQTFPGGGGGPIAVQTYGSLGYGSMGDGSMDMAVRGSRRYSGKGKMPKRIGPRSSRRARKYSGIRKPMQSPKTASSRRRRFKRRRRR